MAYRNDSVAYDISIFEKRAQPEIQIIENKAKRQQKSVSFLSIKTIMLVFVALLFIAVSIYGKVMMTETVDELGTATNELNILKGETTRLEMELESKVSLRNVESFASTNLGMNKIEKYQTEYVKMTEGNVIEVTPTENVSITEKIKTLFSDFWNTWSK